MKIKRPSAIIIDDLESNLSEQLKERDEHPACVQCHELLQVGAGTFKNMGYCEKHACPNYLLVQII